MFERLLLALARVFFFFGGVGRRVDQNGNAITDGQAESQYSCQRPEISLRLTLRLRFALGN